MIIYLIDNIKYDYYDSVGGGLASIIKILEVDARHKLLLIKGGLSSSINKWIMI